MSREKRCICATCLIPQPGPDQLLVKIAVCRTDLHIVDVEAASLLCAGLIGYHAQKMAGNADRVRVYDLGCCGSYRGVNSALSEQ